jgi:pyrroloquinoline quinone biosynthesis protein D
VSAAATPVSAPTDCTPRLAGGFRLQWEPAQNARVLLYPEGMVKLNGSAGEILARCDGVRRADEIVADLERSFERSGLQADVLGFLGLAQRQGWVLL